MSFRSYLIVMALSTLIAWGAWGFVLVHVNPLETGAAGFILFYVTLITGLIGLFSLLGIVYRLVVLKRTDVVIREVKTSYRHAMLLSILCVFSLALSAKGYLRFWVLIVLIIVSCVIEYLSLLVQQSRRG